VDKKLPPESSIILFKDMTAIEIKRVSYGGWKNCVQVKNGIVDLIITTDIGPRIIRCGFIGKENEFCEIESTMGLTGGDEWRLYGGHRLWHSPESRTRTYIPDNAPVRWEEIPNGIKTIQEVEPETGIKKEMEITLSSGNGEVRVLHRLTNLGVWPVELSVWSISAMAPGGKEVIPQPNRDTGLLPNRLISLWPYSRLDDPRVYWGDRYIILQQDPNVRYPFKFGISNEDGWAAYFNHNHLFVKYYSHDLNARYPDLGVSYETYVNDFMLEMETLSPLVLLQPEASVEHKEQWELFDNVAMPSNNEEEIYNVITKRVGPA
jgi:hypothetical protein